MMMMTMMREVKSLSKVHVKNGSLIIGKKKCRGKLISQVLYDVA